MKKQIFPSLAVIALCFSFALTACRSQAQSGSANPLDREALAEAQKYWETHSQKCGDSQFAYYFGGRGHAPGATLLQFTEPAGFACVRDEHPLTEADKLNELEWRGTCGIVCNSYRANLNLDGRWGKWRDRSSFDSDFPGFDSIQIRKIKGHWEFMDQTYDSLRARLEPVPCDQVDKLLASK